MTFSTLLIWTSLIEGVGLLGLAVLLLLHALGLRWRDLRNRPKLALARKSLVQSLETGWLGKQGFKRLSSLSRPNQMALLTEMIPSLIGSQKEWLTDLAGKIGLIVWADARCRSRWWWRRLEGARLHSLLGSGDATVPQLLADRHPVVQAQAAEWAADHPSPQVIVALLTLLNRASGLSRFAIRDSLLRMGSPVVEPLRVNLSNLSGMGAEATLEVAIGLSSTEFLAAALTLCRDKTANVRSLAATLLGALGGSESVDLLVELLRDPAPQVRAAAAAALRKLGHWPAASALAPLLRDPNWGGCAGKPGWSCAPSALRAVCSCTGRSETNGNPRPIWPDRCWTSPNQCRRFPSPMDGLVRYLVPVLTRMEWASLVYFFIVNSLYGVLLVSACWQMCQHILRTKGENLSRVLGSAVAPTISMLAPAHDEAATITESVTSLMAVSYPNLEVIVVNDGSSDETMSVLIEEFELVPIYPIFQDLIQTKPVERLYRSRSYPNLVVADKQNGGKADALNAALNLATGQLVCAIDADTLIETDALQRMARPFLAGEQVLAAGGTIRLVNSSRVRRGRVVNARAPREALPGIQAVEYMRAFLFGRLGWNSLGGNLIISGAFGLFRREAMIKVGGYARDTVGEDMELILRLRCQSYEEKRPHKVAFIPDPVAWTEAPESFRMLGNQRDRWHRGLADVIWRYRRVFFNPPLRHYGNGSLPLLFLRGIVGAGSGGCRAIDPDCRLRSGRHQPGLRHVVLSGSLRLRSVALHPHSAAGRHFLSPL